MCNTVLIPLSGTVDEGSGIVVATFGTLALSTIVFLRT